MNSVLSQNSGLKNSTMLIKEISEHYKRENFQGAYEAAMELAEIYSNKGDSVRYYNMLSKANQYLSRFEPEEALGNQFKLVQDYSFGIHFRLDHWESYLKDFTDILSRNSKSKNNYTKLGQLLESCNNAPEKRIILLKQMGNCATYVDDYRAALGYFLDCFIASNYYDLESLKLVGRSLYSLNEFGLAIDAYMLSLSQQKDSVQMAIISNELGNCFSSLQDHQTALLFYKGSLSFRLAIIENQLINLPIVYQNIGMTFDALQNPDSAITYLNRSYQFCLEKSPNDFELLGNICNNIGNHYMDNGPIESAYYFYLMSLNYRENISSLQKTSLIFESYGNIARYFKDSKDFIKTAQYLDSAEMALNQINELSLPKSGNYSSHNLNTDEYLFKVQLAESFLEIYKNNPTLDNLNRCIEYQSESIQSLRATFTALFDEVSKLTISPILKETIMNMIDIQIISDSLSSSIKPEFIYELISNCQNSQLLDLIEKKRVNNQIIRSKYYRLIKEDIDWERIDSYDSKKFGNPITLFLSAMKENPFNLNDTTILNNLTTIVNHTGFNSFKTDYNSLSKLNLNESITCFAIDEQNNRIIYFQHLNGTSKYGIIDNLNEIRAYVTKLTNSVKTYQFDYFSELLIQSRSFFSESLYLDMADITKTIIIPDGFLWDMPFDAIPTRYENKQRYIIQDREIVYHVSATLLLEGQSKHSDPIRTWVGLAPVEFQSESTTFNTLTNSKSEIQQIDKFLDSSGICTNSFMFKDASFKNLIKYRNVDFLHLASHTREDNINGSSVFLYNDQDLEPLNYHSVQNLNITPSNLFLNTCSANTSRHIKGEGLINLNRAFLINGTENILYTNWEIADSFAESFAVGFYRKLHESNSISIALCETKRSFIKSQDFSHPIWWSNFQVICSN